MSRRYPSKAIFTEIVSLLIILLFVYAAASKILDFENFQAQIGQSPLINAYAGFISYAVLAVELAISIVIGFPRFRIFGLFAAFGLMVMFTAYIAIMLGFSSDIPCSCGGILSKMGWKEHLYFNICFSLLAAAGVLTTPTREQNNTKSQNYEAL